MSNNLADFIERCILGKFVQNQDEYILMRRNDLAIELSCAPSQISYVLNTRFTPERGFIVKSRRGAGGFVRIIKVLPYEQADSKPDVHEFLQYLFATKAISDREYALLKHFLQFSASYLDEKEQFNMLQNMLQIMEQG